MIYLIATLTLKPGSVEAVKEIALPCIEATRREPGCLSYDLNQSLTDENTLMFIERWKDQAALDSHFKEPHLSTWREAAAPYFTDRAIEIIEPQVVKNL